MLKGDGHMHPWEPPTSRAPLDVLTGLRGWAALWVLLYHAWGYSSHPDLRLDLGWWVMDLTPLVSIGFAGVTIFFVLSGFLLSLPFVEWQSGQGGRPNLGPYLKRRVLRVFPAYYAQLLLLVLLALWWPGQPGLADAGAWLRHLIMLFTPPPLGMVPINGVWWTLPIEFSFYLVLPLMAFLVKPNRWWWLLVGSLVLMVWWRHGVAVSMAATPVPQRVVAAYQLPGSMDAFGLGMLTAMLYVHRDRWPAWLLTPAAISRLAWLGLTLVLCAVYWLPVKRHEYWADNPIFYLWTPTLVLGVCAVILSGALQANLVMRLFANRTMIYLGLISYSLYLWHFPILTWLVGTGWVQAAGLERFATLLALSLPPILLVSTLSYRFVELPGMRMARSNNPSRR